MFGSSQLLFDGKNNNKKKKISTYSFIAGVKTFLQLSVYANLYRTCNETSFRNQELLKRQSSMSVCKEKDLNMNLFRKRTKLEIS